MGMSPSCLRGGAGTVPRVTSTGMFPLWDNPLALTFQVDDLPVTAVDTSVGTPPARAPRGQREEEEVPGLGLGHPVGHNVEVLTHQPLAEEERRRARHPGHRLGTRPCFRATGVPGTSAASPIRWLILHPWWLGHSSEKVPPFPGAEHPWVLRKGSACWIGPCCARGEMGGVGHSWDLPAWSRSPGRKNTQCQPRRCWGDGPWAPVSWCHPLPEVLVPAPPEPVIPRSPASARAGGTARPGLAGSAPGCSPVGRGGRASLGSLLAPIACWHPSLLAPTPDIAHPQPAAAFQDQQHPHPHPYPPPGSPRLSTGRVPAVRPWAPRATAGRWHCLGAGGLPAGSPGTWARRFICKEKTRCRGAGDGGPCPVPPQGHPDSCGVSPPCQNPNRSLGRRASPGYLTLEMSPMSPHSTTDASSCCSKGWLQGRTSALPSPAVARGTR